MAGGLASCKILRVDCCMKQALLLEICNRAAGLQVWELYRYRNGQLFTQGAAFAYDGRLLCAALPHCH